ncbi:hypothetical protein BZG36_00699 [Bifiguratus adelaidae]|uniref:Metallo-beta-lactamase domain-containing protein n=1 Tax=Bifiguratus adelaidae TaxID=1938954 RepID=A0A261Y6Z2_9FUNG|nr:hypothetical protein BZG36_00699 [Bifiguratus adelaidae]
MDWWDDRQLTLPNSTRSLKITCTPCQHFTGRSVTDRFKTLWASWAVEAFDVVEGSLTCRSKICPITATSEQMHDEEYLQNLERCPAFEVEIGQKLGPFDLSLISIGAYTPRWFMSPIHCSPEDAVRVHEDVKSRQSIGMHWGTWVLTTEEVMEPPRLL